MASIHPINPSANAAMTDAAPRDMRNQMNTPSRQPPVLALTNNPNMLEILRRAVPGGSNLVEVTETSKLNESCLSARPGVLLVDTTMGVDIQRTTIQLMQDLPELVVVMVGRTEESDTLKKLAAAGQIYRFMLVPLAHGQTKLTLEAAMTQHMQLSDAASRRSANSSADAEADKPVKNYLPIYLGLGAALIVVVGGAFFGLSRMGKTPTDQTMVASNPNGGMAAKELALADAALAAGKLLEPPGESALDLYRSALNIDPKNARAKVGIDNVSNKLLEQVEAALTAQKLDVAVAALEQARDVSPDNQRLKFYDGQIASQRELLKLTQAQDTGKKIRALLADAQENMDAGRFINPAGNNARDAIAEARRIDPTDPAIAQAQRTLNSRLVDAARRAAEQGQSEQAQNLVAAARQMGSAVDLSAVERSLSDARSRSSAEAQAAAQRAAQAQAEAAQKAAAEAAKAASSAAAAPVAAPAAPLPAVTLKIVKSVSPIYPPEAQRRGVSGWVQVSFTVLENGSVDNVRAVDSEPKEIFDWAAVQAVEQWRFERPMRNGKATTQATSIKLRFNAP